MSAQSFDFTSYLEKLTGATGWHIVALPGGAANFTVRAVRYRRPNSLENQNEELLNVFQPNVAVVIKQAPPFLAKAPQFSFSSYRQVCLSPPASRLI